MYHGQRGLFYKSIFQAYWNSTAEIPAEASLNARDDLDGNLCRLHAVGQFPLCSAIFVARSRSRGLSSGETIETHVAEFVRRSRETIDEKMRSAARFCCGRDCACNVNLSVIRAIRLFVLRVGFNYSVEVTIVGESSTRAPQW